MNATDRALLREAIDTAQRERASVAEKRLRGIVCAHCGLELTQVPRGRRLYCSDRCRRAAHPNNKRRLPRLRPFAERFRATRKARGMTLEAVALHLDVPYRTIRQWEAWRRGPGRTRHEAVANFLGMDVPELIAFLGWVPRELRTHCLRGHEFTPENIGKSRTRRQCRACDRDRARRAHCVHGHEFSPENTLVRSDGQRECIECKRARIARRGLAPPATTGAAPVTGEATNTPGSEQRAA